MPLEIKKIGTLEIEASATQLDTTFFILQRLGIVILLIIVLAAILGFFGTGIFGKRKIAKPSIQIQYDKFLRLQATNVYHITIYPEASNDTSKSIQLAIDSDFFKKVSIKSINPAPIQQEIRDNKIIYTFLATHIKEGANITLLVEPEEFGRLITKMEVITPKEESVNINQLIYP